MKNIEILFAEDDPDDRSFFKEALSEAAIPAELKTFENGEELTDYLSLVKNPPPPDIIFLDINMPVKNGKDCLKEIRANKDFNDVPVIMFSTSSYYKDIEESYSDGANMYIFKSEFFDNEIELLNKLFSGNWENDLMKTSREKFILKAG